MSKTKSQQVTNIGTDPRVRMKEVRRMVSKAVKAGKRVDLIALNPDDKDRALVALQDLLEREKERHVRARGHLMQNAEAVEQISGYATAVTDDAFHRMIDEQIRIGNLTQQIEYMASDMHQLEMANDNLSEANFELAEKLDRANCKLHAALQTVKTMAEGVDFA